MLYIDCSGYKANLICKIATNKLILQFYLQLDVVAFANLAQVYFIDKEVSYPLRDYMTESCQNLVGLVNRMKERCFPDWDDICATLDLNSHLPKPPADEGKDKEGSKDEKEGDKEKEPEDKDIEKEKVGFEFTLQVVKINFLFFPG